MKKDEQPYRWQPKQEMTPEEKVKARRETIRLLEKALDTDWQGNIVIPVARGMVGHLRIELFTDPLKCGEIYNLGGK